METVGKLLTTHCRSDRFSDGHLLSIMEDGQLLEILKRLQQLAQGENISTTFNKICEAQKRWADLNQKQYDQNNRMYCRCDNFILPLSGNTIDNFNKGSGDEIGKDNSPGKINSLYSSSALVCNVFEYWRAKDMNIIARLCGAKHNINELHFEKQHPTGLKGTPPNLDIEFSSNSEYALAIESKFTEIYIPNTHKKPFRESYFSKEEIWANLSTCKKLAEDIRDKRIMFVYLDAPQLIKHCLGLMKSYGSKSNFTLTYLWYDFPSPELDQHNAELNTFKTKIVKDIDFVTISYHTLFEEIRKITDVDLEYVSYLQERYFYRIGKK